MKEDTIPHSLPRHIITRSCSAVAVGVGAAALLAFGLATWGNLEEPRGLYAGLHAEATSFPDSDAKLAEMTQKILAEQGAKLDDIAPAAGAPEKSRDITARQTP